MGLIAKSPRESSAHWYTKDGAPCHEVPYADPSKGMRSTTLADAKKMGLLPSVTTILNLYAKPQLVEWKVEQGILACSTDPIRPGELADDYAARMRDEAERVTTAARDLGSAIHAAIEDELGGRPGDWPQGHEATRDAFRSFAARLSDFYTELVVTNPSLGYAGRVDFVGKFDGEPAIIDWKTTGTKPGRKVTGYDEWPKQLAAYRNALNLLAPPRLFNVVFSTTEPGRVEVLEQTEKAERSWRRFRVNLFAWCEENDYWPAGPFDCVESCRVTQEGQVAADPSSIIPEDSLVAAGQISGLRQLASGEGRLTLDVSPEVWPLLAMRGSVGTMCRVIR